MDIQKILDKYISEGWKEIELIEESKKGVHCLVHIDENTDERKTLLINDNGNIVMERVGDSYGNSKETQYSENGNIKSKKEIHRDFQTEKIETIITNSDGNIEMKSLQDEHGNEYTETRYYENGNIKCEKEILEQENDFLVKKIKAYDRVGNEFELYENFDSLNGNMKISLTDSDGKEMSLDELFENEDFEFLQDEIDFNEEVDRDENGKINSIKRESGYNDMNCESYIYYDGNENVAKIINDVKSDYSGFNYRETEYKDGKISSDMNEYSWNKARYSSENRVYYADQFDQNESPANKVLIEYEKYNGNGYYADGMINFRKIDCKSKDREDIFEYLKQNNTRAFNHIENNIESIMEEKNKTLLGENPNLYGDKVLDELTDNVNEQILQEQIEELQSELENKKGKLAEIEEKLEKARDKKKELEKEKEEKQNPNIG